MFTLALKNLWQERTKLAITVGGVAFSVLLIVMLTGLYQGFNTVMGAYAKSIEADLWVEQEGVGDMYHTLSFLPDNLAGKIAGVAGVRAVYPYLGRAFRFELNDEDVTLFVVGYDPAVGIAKPYRMIEGDWRTIRDGEIIVDQAFSRNNQVTVGDRLTLSDTEFKIAGISSGGNLITSQYAFIPYNDAKTLFKLGSMVNFYLVQTEPGRADDQVGRTIEASVAGTHTLSKAEFVTKATSVIDETFLPIILVLELIALAVGTAVIGLTTTSAVIERAREYAVMKAIGFTNGQVLRLVFYQALAAGVVGYAIGAALAFPVGVVGERYASAFVIAIRPIDLAWVGVLTLVMVLIAAYLPTHRISRIDPATVFKS